MSRYRHWCVTWFKKPIDLEPLVGETIRYAIYQKEKAPSTGKKHWQGYIEFFEKLSISHIKQLLEDDTVHLERMRGTADQAIAYCSKLESRANAEREPAIFGHRNIQGKRTDLEDIWDDIESRQTLKTILHTHGGKAVRYIHSIIKASEIMWGENSLNEKQEKFWSEMEKLSGFYKKAEITAPRS